MKSKAILEVACHLGILERDLFTQAENLHTKGQAVFAFADAGNHELTMHSQGDSLSRSYIVKECRKELNSLRPCEIINHQYSCARSTF